jgi:hypothetical protein
MTGVDELWGGTISAVDLNLAEHRLILVVDTLTAGVREVYRLTFTGVTSFSFSDEVSDTWDYVELTEIRTNSTLRGQTITDLVFWNEPAGCQVVADGLSIEAFEEHDLGRSG